jgi:isoleucyl-tRNA synthetase
MRQMQRPQDIPSVYSPEETEAKWYPAWESRGAFKPRTDGNRAPYTIVIPPPNVTGSLHMGHALNNTLQDVLIRWRRMKGDAALWVPGTDHGGIATQNVVEKLLKKEGKTRHDFSRDQFLERMWAWRKESGDTILHQLRRLGCSLDWTRTRFTMDEASSRAVAAAFAAFFQEGLDLSGGAAWSTGAPVAPRRCPTSKWSTKNDRAPCGTFATLLRTAAGTWWWPPPGPKPCWATPRWRSTRRTDATQARPAG